MFLAVNDLLKQLGALAFATRLKRLAESLQRDASKIYHSLDVDFEARWFVVVYALSKKSPRSVTEIAEAVGLTHPAVNQIAGELARHKLITSRQDRKDERRRLLALSKKGRRMASDLQEIWDDIEEVTGSLIKDCGVDLLSGIEQIEISLAEKSIYSRVRERLRKKLADKIEILTYRPYLKKYFKSINEEWLKSHFKIEDRDRRILSDPNRLIIKKGGQVLFARRENKIIGTAALIPCGEKCFQLTKMAVLESARGKQAGRRLAEEAIACARSNQADKIILQTSTKLKTALNLYRSLGFEKVNYDKYDLPRYRRRTIVMELKLR